MGSIKNEVNVLVASDKKRDISEQFFFQAYAKIPTILHCDHLHCIRGDNYCGIRSSLFQIFVNGISLVHKYCSLDSVLETLHILFDDASSGLQDWTFAGRLKYDVGDQLPLMDKCLLTLFTKVCKI